MRAQHQCSWAELLLALQIFSEDCSMRRIAFLSAILIVIALPAFAASPGFELTGWASWVNTNSSTAFNSSAPDQPFGISLHNKVGWGAGANIFWLHNISTDFSAVEVRPSSRFVAT